MRYDVISSRWSSHFWMKMHVFSTSFNNKSNDAKCLFMCYFTCQAQKLPFLAVLTWFLILGKIQDGDHCWWCHRPPAVPPPIKYTSSCWADQRLSTEGKIASKYCNISKPLGRGSINNPPPPPPNHGGGMNLHVCPRFNSVENKSVEKGMVFFKKKMIPSFSCTRSKKPCPIRHFLTFHLSHVPVSRPGCLSEFYCNRILQYYCIFDINFLIQSSFWSLEYKSEIIKL